MIYSRRRNGADLEQIGVFIVDAHPLFRQGIRATIESQPDMTVVGEAADGQVAVNEATAASPDLMLIDVALPVMNGLEVLRSIKHILVACQENRSEQNTPDDGSLHPTLLRSTLSRCRAGCASDLRRAVRRTVPESLRAADDS